MALSVLELAALFVPSLVIQAEMLACDTLLGLKPRSFLGHRAMIQATDDICRLASVLAFTQNAHIMRDTILHDGWCWYFPRHAMQRGREDIDLSHNIAVSAE